MDVDTGGLESIQMVSNSCEMAGRFMILLLVILPPRLDQESRSLSFVELALVWHLTSVMKST